MFELEKDARKQLRMLSDDKSWNCKTLNVDEIPDHRMGSLYEYLSTVPDFRSRRGQRFGNGSRDSGATVRFVQRDRHSGLLQKVEATAAGGGALRAIMETARRRATFHRVLSNVDPEALDKALREWTAQYQDPNGILDGKSVRGASRRGDGCHLVGAVEHETGLICGQVKVADKSNEIPAARKLLRSMQLSGRIVTADAMHTQVETTQLILDRGADYLMVVKGNQKTILDESD